MTAFFIIRDITEQKRVEEERALEEERYNIALRNTYTEIYEIDLSADTPHLVYAADTPMIPVDHDKNGNIHTIAATLIHPEDRERFLTAFIGSNIRKEFRSPRRIPPPWQRRQMVLGFRLHRSAVRARLLPYRQGDTPRPRHLRTA